MGNVVSLTAARRRAKEHCEMPERPFDLWLKAVQALSLHLCGYDLTEKVDLYEMWESGARATTVVVMALAGRFESSCTGH